MADQKIVTAELFQQQMNAFFKSRSWEVKRLWVDPDCSSFTDGIHILAEIDGVSDPVTLTTTMDADVWSPRAPIVVPPKYKDEPHVNCARLLWDDDDYVLAVARASADEALKHIRFICEAPDEKDIALFRATSIRDMSDFVKLSFTFMIATANNHPFTATYVSPSEPVRLSRLGDTVTLQDLWGGVTKQESWLDRTSYLKG